MKSQFILFVFLSAFTTAVLGRRCLYCSSGPPNSGGGDSTEGSANRAPRFLFTPEDKESPDLGFSQFVSYYGIWYDSLTEFSSRRQAFAKNLEAIQELNSAQINSGGEPVFGLSPFLDFTPQEFAATFLGLPPHNISTRPVVRDASDQDVAVNSPPAVGAPAALSAIDWRTRGAVTRVRDQGQCGSCWAHSATEAVESFYFLKKQRDATSTNYTIPTLSVQQLLGCTYDYDGCDGGWPTDAMQTVINRRGIVTQASYPYNSRDGVSCKFGTGRATNPAATISSYATASPGSLANVLQTRGPPSVCLCSTSLQYYTGGVMRSCCTQQDHCVQAVGIGKSTSGSYYYIMRNSWGIGWGEQGYFYLDATASNGNLCGIQEQIDYPII